MKYSPETKAMMKADEDRFDEKRISEMPIRIHLHGRTIEAEHTKIDYSGGEVNIYLDGEIVTWENDINYETLRWEWINERQ